VVRQYALGARVDVAEQLRLKAREVEAALDTPDARE
jgi:hypothetical protein